MSNVTKLPTAATSFFQVRRAGRAWACQLVTPCVGKAIRTTLLKTPDYNDAVAYALDAGERQQRPVKIARGPQS